jgi:hypothetical protein
MSSTVCKAVLAALAALGLGGLIALAKPARQGWQMMQEGRHLRAQVERIDLPADGAELPCREPGGVRPLVLLALGQSNAANHGPEQGPMERRAAVTVFDGHGCRRVGDPLPGGTGSGQSIWSRLPGRLAAQGVQRPVLLAVRAVDATSISDWTRADSPLRLHLVAFVRAMGTAGLAPDFVLWQQGEADQRSGTGQSAYTAELGRLHADLRDAGALGPLLLARSTVCRSGPGEAVRAAMAAFAADRAGVQIGPDTDTLTGDLRRDGCHFSAAGLDAAAELWAQTLIGLLR